MKQFIIAMMLLLLCAGLSAEWLDVEFAFQLGWIPQGNINIYESFETFHSEPFDIVLDVTAKLYKIIRIGGICTSYFSIYSFSNFIPTGITYLVFVGIESVKGLSFNYEHSCTHPIMPYLSHTPSEIKYEAGFDRIYLELKCSFPF